MAKKERASLKEALLSNGTEEKSPEVYLSTGCDLLDLVVGGGMGMGHRAGTLANYVAPEAVGKSFLMGELIAKNYHTRENFVWKYDDVEHRFRFNTHGLYGIQIVEPDEDASDTVEELDAALGSWLRKRDKDTVGVYVVDSLDQLANADTLEREDKRIEAYDKGKEPKESGTYGMGSAKFLAQEFFRTKMTAIKGTSTLLIFISQVRDNIGAGMFGKKYKRTGGKALDHACNDIIWLTKVSPIRKRGLDGVERDVGNLVMAKTTKSSTARPFRECVFPLYYDYGIDNIGANVDYLFDLRDGEYKLTTAAKAVPWIQREPQTLEALKDFLATKGLLGECKESKRRQGRAANLSEDYILEWIEGQPDAEVIQMALQERFGITQTREELIATISENPEMQKELTTRVIQKWEAVEASMLSNRRKKYE